jgi:hypothetical protein
MTQSAVLNYKIETIARRAPNQRVGLAPIVVVFWSPLKQSVLSCPTITTTILFCMVLVSPQLT